MGISTRRALAVARAARLRFDLTPVVDYADLPAFLRNLHPRDDSSTAKRLVVVGGGMLAQAIALRSRTEYTSTVIVTRNAPRLRRSLLDTFPKDGRIPEIIGPATAPDVAGDKSFDLVLATTSRKPSYIQSIEAIASQPNVKRIIDLCATPFFERRLPKYKHIADADIIDLITLANSAVAERAKHAQSWIEHITGLPEAVNV